VEHPLDVSDHPGPRSRRRRRRSPLRVVAAASVLALWPSASRAGDEPQACGGATDASGGPASTAGQVPQSTPDAVDPAVTKGDLPRPVTAPATTLATEKPPDRDAWQATVHFLDETVHGVSESLKKQGWVTWNEYRGTCATMNLHTRQMFDFTFFVQDATNVSQVGKADPQFQWREARFMLSGRFLCFKPAWSYYVSIEYGGFNLPQGQRFGVSEAWIGIPINDWLGTVEVGKVQQAFSIESLTSGGSLTFMERSLEAFDLGDQIGIALRNSALRDRLTWQAGFYYDFFTDSSTVGGAVRVTGLPVDENGGALLLHVGASGRYLGAAGGSLQLQARPATHVGPYFADTGSFPAWGSWGFDVEALAVLASVTLQAEFLENWVGASQAGNPSLFGWYVKGAWLVTGEVLPFEREKAVPGYIVPKRDWGAIEVAIRYWMNSLDGGSVSGGVLRDVQAGATFYLGKFLRADFNYGHVWLYRFGVTGQSGVYGFRLQLQV